MTRALKRELKRLDQSLSTSGWRWRAPAQRLLRLWPGGGRDPVRLFALSLKLIAIAAMVVDHVAFTFVPYGTPLWTVMDAAGKLTGPIMFYMAVEGFHHTRSIRRYLARLAVFAGVSYFPFLYFCAMGQPEQMNPLRLNVIYTISWGYWPSGCAAPGLHPPGRPAPPAGLPEHPPATGASGASASSSCWTSITATSAIRPSATHWSSCLPSIPSACSPVRPMTCSTWEACPARRTTCWGGKPGHFPPLLLPPVLTAIRGTDRPWGKWTVLPLFTRPPSAARPAGPYSPLERKFPLSHRNTRILSGCAPPCCSAPGSPAAGLCRPPGPPPPDPAAHLWA